MPDALTSFLFKDYRVQILLSPFSPLISSFSGKSLFFSFNNLSFLHLDSTIRLLRKYTQFGARECWERKRTERTSRKEVQLGFSDLHVIMQLVPFFPKEM